MRPDRERDPRLRGGIEYRCGDRAGVLYNADGIATEALATPFNTTLAIITRNRRAYLQDLLQSLEPELPPTVNRYILVNNTTDDTVAMLAREFPHWTVDVVQAAGFPPVSPGLTWIRKHQPKILPPALRTGAPAGFGPTDSIAWLRNRMFARCRSRFIISFDDDMLVKPGWFDYLITLQNNLYAFAVINNFAAFLIDRAVVDRIGWFDERYLRSHGYEDNDYTTRINEARLRWVLGYNIDHDWRSAEEGNPRGSGSGSDLFIHRYAKSRGGFSASAIENQAREKDSNHFGNWRWQDVKWKQVPDASGFPDRPPYKGYTLLRQIRDEPAWGTAVPLEAPPPTPPPGAEPAGRKTTQNTATAKIDPLANPPTATMVDRYSFLTHWIKEKEVLDLGCGHGYGSAIVNALGAKHVLGVDLDAGAIDACRQKLQTGALQFEVADVLNLPAHLHGRFDVVLCVEVFEHLPAESIPQLLTQIRLALRDTGTLVLTTPRRKSPEWDYHGGTHLYEYSCQEFRDTFAAQFPQARRSFAGIREFQVPGSPQWFSRWQPALDDTATVMLAVVEFGPDLPPLDPVLVSLPAAAQAAPTTPSAPDPAAESSGLQSISRVMKKLARPAVRALKALTGAADGGSPPAPPPPTTVSILLSNRNTLPYLQLAVKSCRQNLTNPHHEIIVYDDGSTDGSVEWLQANADRYDLRVFQHPGPDRKGIVYIYDEMVQAATHPVVFIIHSDMVFARNADSELLRYWHPGTVATSTRIEPPLYPDEPYRITRDFGHDAAAFRETEFLQFADEKKDLHRTTAGIFAPILISRVDYLAIGGHDKVFAPQSREDSDLFNRMSLAGYRFVQSWSSLCYHFSGKGSRRKDAAVKDSAEWQWSNSKNERNFLRKWGAPVRHDKFLKPIVTPKIRLSLVGLLGNESHNVTAWLQHLEPYVDEIILVNDSSDDSLAKARAYFAQEAALSPLVYANKLQILDRPLDNDYAAARNAAHAAATFDWVLHLDLDERMEPQVLPQLQDILARLQRDGLQVCGFPRWNLLDGALVNDLPRSEWTPENLAARAGTPQLPPPPTLQNRDPQYRLLRREVRWTRPVHEIPEPTIGWAPGLPKQPGKPVTLSNVGAILHLKTLRHQAEQDLRYRQQFGAGDAHAAWNPQAILDALAKRNNG